VHCYKSLIESKRRKCMKVLSFLLSMVNTLVSVLILLSCVSKKYLHWVALGQIAGRVITASFVLLIGVFTFCDGMRPLRPEKLLIGGLILILLGASCTVCGIYLTINTGDLKLVFLIYGGSLLVQGIASIGGMYETQDETIPQ